MGPAGVLLFFFVIILAISSEPATTAKTIRVPFKLVDSNTTSRLRRRDNANIPLKSFQEKLWKGTIGFGNPPQQVDVVFDTGSADTWVASADCDNCGNLPRYDMSKSQGAEDLQQEFDIVYGDGDQVKGIWTSDIVTLGTVPVPNQAFARAQHVYDALVGNGHSGLVGLGFETDYEDMTPIITTLNENIALDSPVIGCRFVKNSPDNAGELLFGGIDNQYVSGPIIYNSLTRSFGQVTAWAIRVNAVQVKDQRMGQRGISATIDTGSSTIGVTPDVAAFVYAGTGAQRVNGQWFVPDPFPSDVTFAFDQGEFSVPADDMVLRNQPKTDDKFPGAIQEYVLNDKWVIGQPFIKNYYLVYNYGALTLGIAKRSS